MKASVLVSFHNHQSLVCRVATSVLAQDFDDFELIFIDDSSTDDTYRVLKETIKSFSGFRGRKIKCLRNEHNLGIVGTFNRLMEESMGELCIVHCGDDVAHVDKVSKIVSYWDKAAAVDSHVVLATTECNILDYNMNLVRAKPQKCTFTIESGVSFFNRGLNLLGATAVYSRKMWELYGPMDPNARYEDHIMAFRAAMCGNVVRIAEPLIDYRSEGGASTSFRTSYSHVIERTKRTLHSFLQMESDLARSESFLNKDSHLKYQKWLVERIERQTLLVDLQNQNFSMAKFKLVKRLCGQIRQGNANVWWFVFFLPRTFVEVASQLRGRLGNAKRCMLVRLFGDPNR